MASRDDEWWDAQAGEYVLGTLQGYERHVFERILRADEEVQERVRFWQEHLSAIALSVPAVEPPKHILPLILQRIRNAAPAPVLTPADSDPGVLVSRESRSQSDTVYSDDQESRAAQAALSHTAKGWKVLSGLALAASLILAALLLDQLRKTTVTTQVPADSISLVQDDQQQTLWLLNARSSTGKLQVVAVNPPSIDVDNSYQLWMVKPDDQGVSSVGLLPLEGGTTVTLDLPLQTEQAALFAVSLEPRGGSPLPTPTGPVLFSGSIVNLQGVEP